MLAKKNVNCIELLCKQTQKRQGAISRIKNRLDVKWLIIRGYGNTAEREGESEVERAREAVSKNPARQSF